MADLILVFNAGSSSVKFAAFAIAGQEPQARFAGQVEGIGAIGRFVARSASGETLVERGVGETATPATHVMAVGAVIDWLEGMLGDGHVVGIGHRVVHGGANHAAPALIGAQVMAELQKLIPLAPLHEPHNMAGIVAAARRFVGVPQVACFDTAFHRTQPWEAETFALPPRFFDGGLRRYGFHGLSYEYISRTLIAENPVLGRGRLVVAHLGNGASLCAIRDGRSQANTMSFTTLDGIPMGTRPGSIDPGAVLHMIEGMGMSAADVSRLLYSGSGLKGMSGVSQDVRQIEAAGTAEAEGALRHFAYRVRREIGALAACLGGIDALVFTAGIGEHAAGVRARICEGLEFLGISVDPARNAAHLPEISPEGARTPVLVRHTDEELMVARHTLAAIAR